MEEDIGFQILNKYNIELKLPNQIGYERIAMACSGTFAKLVGFGSERIEDLKSAVAEACVNAMQHGNKGKPEARVVVNMNFKDDTFIVSVIDQGEGMPAVPEFVGAVKIIEEDVPVTGLGVFMIQRLVDNVTFNQMTPDGHKVTLEMKLTE
jgi:serine/threonine-protein kinase RsbW